MSLLHGVGEFFALDIGTNAIRLVQLSGGSEKGYTLQHFSYVPVDPKVVQDTSELGKRKLGETILGAVKQAGVKTKRVALGLPARKTYTAIIEVPNLPEKELRKTIKYELDQYVPMAIEEAEVDYAILGESPANPEKAEILLSSTSKQYAEEQMELLEDLGFDVIVQEPEAIAMTRALAPVGMKGAQLIIDLGENSTDLVIMFQGKPRLVRTVPGGLSVMTKTLANTLNVREDQAKQFILRFGLAQDQLEGKVYKVLDPILDEFAQELSKSIKFFQAKYTNTLVGQIVLAGYAGVIPMIDGYVEIKTNVNAVKGNAWQKVQMTPEQQKMLASVASEFGVVIGLAERINDNVRD